MSPGFAGPLPGDRAAAPGPRRVRVRGREMAAAVLLYLVLTLALAWPLSGRPGSTVLAAVPDTELFIWTLAWDAHAFVSQPASLFEANIYAPERRTLAYSENLIGSALVAAPVIWLTGNPVLAMNVAALLSCVLCGFGAWLLARRAGVGQSGALLAGIVFAFSAPRFLRTGQLHLAPVQWVPLALVFLQAYLDDRRPRDLRLALGMFTLQALSSGHGAVFLLVAMAALAAFRLRDVLRLFTPAEGPAWSGVVRPFRDAGLPGALFLLPAALAYIPYRLVQLEVGLRRPLENWSIPAASFLASPAHLHEAVLAWFSNERINQEAAAYLFPGYVPLLLAAVTLAIMVGGVWRPAPRATDRWRRAAQLVELALLLSIAAGVYVTAVGSMKLTAWDVRLFSARDPVRAWALSALFAAARIALAARAPFDTRARARRLLAAAQAAALGERQNMIAFYALLTLLSVLLSIGPPLGLWPLVYWLPGFSFIRVPSRFTILAMLGLAVLAGAGLEALRRHVSQRRAAWLALLAGALLIADIAVAPLEVTPYRIDIPAVDRWLDRQPKPFTVAEVPAPDPRNASALERRQTLFMLHSMAHWQKTVHGYSGIRPERHAALYAALARFPDEESLDRLAELNVTYVVAHKDLYGPDWEAASAAIARFADRLAPVHDDAGGRVYALRNTAKVKGTRPF